MNVLYSIYSSFFRVLELLICLFSAEVWVVLGWNSAWKPLVVPNSCDLWTRLFARTQCNKVLFSVQVGEFFMDYTMGFITIFQRHLGEYFWVTANLRTRIRGFPGNLFVGSVCDLIVSQHPGCCGDPWVTLQGVSCSYITATSNPFKNDDFWGLTHLLDWHSWLNNPNFFPGRYHQTGGFCTG